MKILNKLIENSVQNDFKILEESGIPKGYYISFYKPSREKGNYTPVRDKDGNPVYLPVETTNVYNEREKIKKFKQQFENPEDIEIRVMNGFQIVQDDIGGVILRN